MLSHSCTDQSHAVLVIMSLGPVLRDLQSRTHDEYMQQLSPHLPVHEGWVLVAAVAWALVRAAQHTGMATTALRNLCT